ncbi:DUF4012 domain-containing protein [Leifsonia sp. NPDC058230]|uniref:DUF4012 domain-containing protein n=1 Tax=Leifsonia sp. NPDC058230 TaxID=3346391 RepID=UPI0036DF0DCF
MTAPEPSDAVPARPPEETRRRTRTRRFVEIGIAVVVLAIVVMTGWVGLRAVMAKDALKDAVPQAQAVQSSLASGDIAAASAAAAELRAHTSEAASLSGDPVWRAAEFIPWVGPNLTAVRVSASAADTVAAKVISPLVAVAEQVDPARLKPVNGSVDLAPLIRAQPVVARAQAAFRDASSSVAGIDDGATIERVRSEVERLRDLLSEAGPTVDALANTAKLLPRMLGADGPRTYLLLVQNPAELRATGGLPGVLALVTADHGDISFAGQVSGTSIYPFTDPVSAIPAATQGLYGPLLARFIQDVNLTPDFPLAASTASTMWKAKYGGTIDGVFTVDPVALSYLLTAIGPVALPTGDTLTADNAVPLLLSESYSRWPDSERQDAFFAAAAEAVFSQVAVGKADGTALIRSLVQAGEERRTLVWSAHPDEQRVLATTTLAGTLPTSTPSVAGLGVYFNDATGAKMDYYLKTEVEAVTAVCRADGTPSSRVAITLTNAAPANAATTLPDYVTGAGWFGVAPGSIRTRVAVYGAEGGLLAATTSGGAEYPTIAGTDAGRPVSVFTVDLAPGEAKTVTVDLLNMKQKAPGMTVAVTPTLSRSSPVVGGSSLIAPGCNTGVN